MVRGRLREGGVWGYLAYAQNCYINAGHRDIGSPQVQDAAGTVLYANTDGWDPCLYPDGDPTANVCYQMSHPLTGGWTLDRKADICFFFDHPPFPLDAGSRKPGYSPGRGESRRTPPATDGTRRMRSPSRTPGGLETEITAPPI